MCVSRDDADRAARELDVQDHRTSGQATGVDDGDHGDGCADLLPIALVFAGAALVLGEQRLAATVLIVVMLAGLCLIEFLTLTMKTVPFSCTYLPGQLKLRVYWAPYLFLWLQFRVHTVELESVGVSGLGKHCSLRALLGAVWIGLRLWHMARARKITAFIYDEQEPSLAHDDGDLDMMRSGAKVLGKVRPLTLSRC